MSRFIWIMLLAALLTACATTPMPPRPTALSWKSRQHSLNEIQDWQLSGKIAVQTANDAGSATIDWQQANQSYTITLSGPLGAGGMKLTGNSSEVTLIDNKGQTYRAQNPERLLADNWGFQLPVSYLHYWVRGLPSPQASYQGHFDANHRLTSFVQGGWLVQYLDYAPQGTIDLPRKMAMNSSTLKAKLVIYDWKIN